MTTVPKLELRGLRKDFGDVAAVDGIDLVVQPGETVALLGPSGCGKSTTLNMIVGLEQPSAGDILVDGRSVLGIQPQARRIGLVFQDYAVFTHLSVRKNLGFGLAVRGTAKAVIREKVTAVAELLGLTQVLDASPRRLGSSELQRVAIGRTLVLEPALLLLDEPLSNLEADLRTAMRQQLRRLQQERGQTLVYVTHDQLEALSLADKIAVMSEGKIRQFATALTAYRQPAHTFVAGFLGTPPMNLLEGELQYQGGAAALVRSGAALALPHGLVQELGTGPRHVVLGVRPEALRPGRAELGGLIIDGLVEVVEPSGAELILTLRVGSWSLKAIVEAGAEVAEGGMLRLAADAEHLGLFDGLSGNRLDPLERFAAAPTLAAAG